MEGVHVVGSLWEVPQLGPGKAPVGGLGMKSTRS